MMEIIQQEQPDFCARMDRAESIIRRVRAAGMDIELSGGKLVIRNFNDFDARSALRDEVVQNCKSIAEWLEIPPAEVSDRARCEYEWLREFAEEFAKTAWRRLGRLPENEFIEFYNLANAEYGDDEPPRIEPGFAALMAIADARMEQCIDINRRADELAQRDGVEPEEWAETLASSAERMAKEGRWKREKIDQAPPVELPF